MDPTQQPQNTVPQPSQPVAPPTPPPAPQPVPEVFGTPAQSPFAQQPVAPAQPEPVAQQPQQPFQQQPFEQPQPAQHFAANHPVPDGTAVTVDNPGKVLGIVGFILVFLGLGLVSLILGIIGLKKSKRAGHKNGFALAAIILGILQTIAALLIGAFLITVAMTLVNTCSELGSGTHVLTDGRTVTCNL